MSNKIFIITGSSGTGKTSVIPFLKKSLGESSKVYDFDTISRPYDLTKEWESDVMKKCFQIMRLK